MTTFDRLKGLFADMMDEGTDLSKVSPLSNLKYELGFSSLTYLLMVFSIQKEFGVDISDAKLDRLLTVQDVVNYIDSKLS